MVLPAAPPRPRLRDGPALPVRRVPGNGVHCWAPNPRAAAQWILSLVGTQTREHPSLGMLDPMGTQSHEHLNPSAPSHRDAHPPGPLKPMAIQPGHPPSQASLQQHPSPRAGPHNGSSSWAPTPTDTNLIEHPATDAQPCTSPAALTGKHPLRQVPHRLAPHQQAPLGRRVPTPWSTLTSTHPGLLTLGLVVPCSILQANLHADPHGRLLARDKQLQLSYLNSNTVE